MRSLEELARFGLSFKGAVRDYPFGPEPLVLKVGGKMFALLAEGKDGVGISLKCEPEMAELLRAQYEAVVPGYHLNKRHWNTVRVDGTVPEEELEWMIGHSYQLVVRSLTKAARESIGV